MKKIIFTLVLALFACSSYCQSNYKRIYKYDEYNKGWALVKTTAGTYGFIDHDKKAVVQPIYTKIEKFKSNYALVKTISDSYGYIDRSGKEVVKAVSFSKEEAAAQLVKLKKNF